MSPPFVAGLLWVMAAGGSQVEQVMVMFVAAFDGLGEDGEVCLAV